MSDTDRPAGALPESLLTLAARYGVVPDFWDFDGTRRYVQESTLVAVLAALGVDAASPERTEVALREADDEPWRRTLPPIVVLRAGTPRQVPVHLPDGSPLTAWIELDPETGGGQRDVPQVDVYTEPRTVDGRVVGRATLEVPGDLPLGWHTLVTEIDGAAARCDVVVTPDRLEVSHGLEERRAWGFMAQLYSVRSERSWGVGDLADLRDLGWLSARRCGADFLLINPLHAAEPVTPLSPSPYLPSSRRFVNPLYLRVEDIPETAYLPVAERSLVEWQAEVARPLSTDGGPIDRDTAWEAKKVALEVVFAAPRSAARQAAFAAFRRHLDGQRIAQQEIQAEGDDGQSPGQTIGQPTRTTGRNLGRLWRIQGVFGQTHLQLGLGAGILLGADQTVAVIGLQLMHLVAIDRDVDLLALRCVDLCPAAQQRPHDQDGSARRQHESQRPKQGHAPMHAHCLSSSSARSLAACWRAASLICGDSILRRRRRVTNQMAPPMARNSSGPSQSRKVTGLNGGLYSTKSP